MVQPSAETSTAVRPSQELAHGSILCSKNSWAHIAISNLDIGECLEHPINYFPQRLQKPIFRTTTFLSDLVSWWQSAAPKLWWHATEGSHKNKSWEQSLKDSELSTSAEDLTVAAHTSTICITAIQWSKHYKSQLAAESRDVSHRKELFLSQPSHRSSSLWSFSHALLKLNCCLKVQSRKPTKSKQTFRRARKYASKYTTWGFTLSRFWRAQTWRNKKITFCHLL